MARGFSSWTVSQSSPMRTGFESMRLGTIIYFVPFFFVLDPGLIMQGEASHILVVTGCALLGVVVLSTSLQGYLYGVGDLTRLGVVQWPVRAMLLIGALAFAMPGNDVIGMDNLELFIAGAVLTGAAAILALLGRRAARAA